MGLENAPLTPTKEAEIAVQNKLALDRIESRIASVEKRIPTARTIAIGIWYAIVMPGVVAAAVFIAMGGVLWLREVFQHKP